MTQRHNFRIYPNKKQEAQILKNFGCCRFVYKYFLEKRVELYKETGKMYGFFEMSRDLTQLKKQEEYRWLNEADAGSLHEALKNMDDAFSLFFKRLKQGGTAPGFPNFKSKRESRQSYKCKYSNKIEVGENAIKIPKLGWVKCRLSKLIEGRLLNAVISRSASGKYHVSLCYADVATAPLPRTGAVMGAQLGLTDLITTSDGIKHENSRYSKQASSKIARLRRELSRKTKGSANYEKARVKFAKASERVKNQKKDSLHKLTTEMVRDYDIICIRDEPVAQILEKQKSKFSGLLSDASWGEIIRQLSYKTEWYGKELIKIDPLLPTTQLCSICGHKHEAVRKHPYWTKWDCPKCGTPHNKAVNAATNIMNQALKTSQQQIVS